MCLYTSVSGRGKTPVEEMDNMDRVRFLLQAFCKFEENIV